MDPIILWQALRCPSKGAFLLMMEKFGGYPGEDEQHAENLYIWVKNGGFWPEEEWHEQ